MVLNHYAGEKEDAYKELFVKFYFSLMHSFARKHLEVKRNG